MLLRESETKEHNTSQKRYRVRVTGSESRGAQVIHRIHCQRVQRNTYVGPQAIANIPQAFGTLNNTAATDHRNRPEHYTGYCGLPQSTRAFRNLRMRTGRDGMGDGWMSQDASDGRNGTVGTVGPVAVGWMGMMVARMLRMVGVDGKG